MPPVEAPVSPPHVEGPPIVQSEAPVVTVPDPIVEPAQVPEISAVPTPEFIAVYVKGMSPVRGQSSDRPWKRLEVQAGTQSRAFSVPKEIARGELRISKIRGVSMRLREVGLASRASDPAAVPETSDGIELEKTIGTVWFLWNPVDESDKGPLIVEFR